MLVSKGFVGMGNNPEMPEFIGGTGILPPVGLPTLRKRRPIISNGESLPAFMSPMVWELEGPGPIFSSSKTEVVMAAMAESSL